MAFVHLTVPGSPRGARLAERVAHVTQLNDLQVLPEVRHRHPVAGRATPDSKGEREREMMMLTSSSNNTQSILTYALLLVYVVVSWIKHLVTEPALMLCLT